MQRSWFLPVSILFSMMLTISAAFASPVDLRCEGATDPAGVDAAAPLLSWTLSSDAGSRGVRQAAYRIRVASTADRLANGEADLWDSGRVESDRLVPVVYAGKPLTSGQECVWSVAVWTGPATPPVLSRPAKWTVGLLTPEDWLDAKWIGDGRPAAEQESLLLRRGFAVKSGLRRAVVFVTGLGNYELSMNGKKVGDHLIAPGWTEYRKTVLYDTFDVTDRIRTGENAMGVVLGNGMYNIKPTPGRYVKFTNTFGPLKTIALLRLEYADGSVQTVGTDRSWSVLPSPITYDNVFGGEDYDARRSPAGWDDASFAPTADVKPAVELDGPGGVLRGHAAAAPPIKAIAVHQPVNATPVTPAITVYDLGQNASHMPRLVVRGEAGAYVRVVPSELLGADGLVDRASCVQDAGGPAWWQYTLAGGGPETYFPKFFYQGCRYLRVERFPGTVGGPLPTVDAIEGVVVHSAAAPVGAFACSNTLFNQTYELVRWAQRSNMMSVMTDCPQREKLGWLEQLHLNGPSLRYNFRLDRLYHKVMNDMADAQLPGGLVPNIAPEYFLAHTDKLDDPFRNSVEWGSSFILAAWQQYGFTGDRTLLKAYYARMLKYHAFLQTMAKSHVIGHGLGDWYDLGPKPPWGSQLTPPAFTATAIYYYDTRVLADAASLLGMAGDAAKYSALADEIRAAFNSAFYDAARGRYATGSQCTSAMPLVLGLVPDAAGRAAVLKTLIDDVRARGNALSAGDVGYRFVLRALADAGRSDVIFEMNNQSARPGYGMQIARGATSLTEKWDASVGSFGSQNHFMLGQINEWFFHDLAGIQPDPATPGFEAIVIKPSPVGDITWVNAAYDSPRGRIVSEWTNTPAGFNLYTTIPAGTTATVYVPASDPASVLEGGRPVVQADGVRALPGQEGYAVFAVGSGTYAFTSAISPARPTGLSARMAGRAVTLAWTPAANAEAYVVTRSADGGTEQAVADGLTKPNFVDTTVLDGKTYSFAVYATLGNRRSPKTEVTAVPAAARP